MFKHYIIEHENQITYENLESYMTRLINKYGLRTVQCKIVCLFLINCIKDYFDKNEMLRLGQENSRFLSYYYRINKLDFEKSAISNNGGIHGESKNVNDSMIYQIAKKIQLIYFELSV